MCVCVFVVFQQTRLVFLLAVYDVLSISVDVHMLFGGVIVFGFKFSKFVDKSLFFLFFFFSFLPPMSLITSLTAIHDLLCDYT